MKILSNSQPSEIKRDRKHISLIKPVDVIALLAATIFAILLNGYREPSKHLSLVFKIANADLLKGDLLSSFVDSGFHHSSFFFVAQAFLSRHVDIWMFNFIGYILLVVAFLVGIFLLAKQIFGRDSIAYLSVALLMVFKLGLAGGDTFHNEFNYNNVATILALFSLVCFIRRRYIPCFILIGFSVTIHLLTALPVLGLYAYYILIMRNNSDMQQRLQLYSALGLFLIIILPWIIYNSNTGASVSLFGPPDPQLWSVMIARAPHHYLPHTWMDRIIRYCPILILSLIAGAYFVQHRDYRDRQVEHRIAFSMLLVFFIYCLLEVVFTEIYPLFIIMKLQFYRFTTFISIMGIIYIAYMMDTILSNPSKISLAIVGEYLFVSGTLIAFHGYDFRLAWMMIPFAIIQLIPDNFRSAKPIKNCLSCFFGGTLIYLVHHQWINQLYFLLTMIGCCLLVACNYLLGFGILSRKVCRRTLVTACILLWVVLPLMRVERLENLSDIRTWKPPTAGILLNKMLRRVNVARLTPMNGEYVMVQLWAHDHTEVDDMFLVPPFNGRFRIYSKRPIFGEWLSGGWCSVDKDLACRWFRRMNALGIYTEHDKEAYGRLTASTVQTLAAMYKISYAVFKKPKQFNFPVAYENRRYIVYRLKKMNTR